jgi:four helix bundle protein
MVERFVAFQKAREANQLIESMVRGWRSSKELVDQATRASTSILFNVSEGTTHAPGSPDRLRYYRYAWGSAVELETILDAASDRGLGPPADLALARSLTSEVARILTTIVTRAA